MTTLTQVPSRKTRKSCACYVIGADGKARLRFCNKLTCAHCGPRIRRANAQRMAKYFDGAQLYGIPTPATDGATRYLQQQISDAGKKYIDIAGTYYTTFNGRANAVKLGSDNETILYDAFIVAPPGSNVSMSRGWRLEEPRSTSNENREETGDETQDEVLPIVVRAPKAKIDAANKRYGVTWTPIPGTRDYQVSDIYALDWITFGLWLAAVDGYQMPPSKQSSRAA